LILLDTHVFIWLIQEDAKLGVRMLKSLEKALTGDGLAVSAITPWEVSMLADKQRIKLGKPTAQWITASLGLRGIMLMPIDPLIGVDAGELPGSIHGDPADRVIIATARSLGCPIATADRKILDYAKTGHVAVIDARK
jgi:PIN domain nuclease of toxin-antitoxin system